MNRVSVIFPFLLLFAGICFAQQEKTIIIHGRVITSFGNSCNEQVLCIDEHTATLKLSAKNGDFILRIRPSDTLLFKAYGYAGKIICLRDSAIKKHYKLIVKVDRLKDTTNDENLASIYSTMVKDLYARFRNIDTSKRFKVQSDDIDEKSEALKKIFGHYINYHIRIMNDAKFYAFVKFLLEKGGIELLNEGNKQLIVDSKRYYHDYRNQPILRKSANTPKPENEGCNGESDPKCKGMGCLIILVACLIEGLSSEH